MIHVLLIAAALFPPSAAAATGGHPGAIFNFGANARALGMGNAYTALSQDDSSVYYNPAGLGSMDKRSVSLTEATLVDGVNYNYIGLGQPALGGGFGLNLLRMGVGGVDGRDENNQATGSLGYSEMAFAAGYGRRGLLDGQASIGVSAKMLQRNFPGDTNRLYGLDAGASYIVPGFDSRLQVAGMAQNLLQASMGDTSDKMPLLLKLGAAWQVVPGLRLVGDFSSDRQFSMGTEYGWRFAAFRVGVQQQGLTFGTGLYLWNGFQVDYAVYNDVTTGLSNRLSVGWRLPTAEKVEGPDTPRPDDPWREAMQALQDRRYVAAVWSMDKALKGEGRLLAGAKMDMARRLHEMITGLNLLGLPARQEELVVENDANVLAGKAVMKYLEGQNAQAQLFAQAALGTYQQEDALHGLLEFLDKRTGRKTPREDILPLRELITVKDARARRALFGLQFPEALREWEEIIVLEPENALAWTRLGSAALASGDIERAKKAYHRFMLARGWN
ncbi:MAG: hypothetical protein NTX64_10125 [Elusimicrobia bacterium]|nr:hypothetical protein [Elusimicrobiota bacterium]